MKLELSFIAGNKLPHGWKRIVFSNCARAIGILAKAFRDMANRSHVPCLIRPRSAGEDVSIADRGFLPEQVV